MTIVSSARYSVAEAKARFAEIIRRAMAGEDVIISKGNKPVVKVVPLRRPDRRKPGSAKGEIAMAPDFDETPVDFDPYLE